MTFIRDISPRFVSENLQELRQLQVAKEIRMLGTQGVDQQMAWNPWLLTDDFHKTETNIIQLRFCEI